MANDLIRVFVSSPGDVAEERSLAGRLLDRLRKEYVGRATIEPVLWEHEPLAADRGFQGQIPRPSKVELVICILWTRLGTRLPPDVRRTDGTGYASGTEFEIEDALAGDAETGRHPTLWVYRRSGFPTLSLGDDKLPGRLGRSSRSTASSKRRSGTRTTRSRPPLTRMMDRRSSRRSSSCTSASGSTGGSTGMGTTAAVRVRGRNAPGSKRRSAA